MELPDTFYSHSDYIETTAGNKVSRQSILCGSQNIVLNGKTIVKNDCIIRGDLANVRIGRQVSCEAGDMEEEEEEKTMKKK